VLLIALFSKNWHLLIRKLLKEEVLRAEMVESYYASFFKNFELIIEKYELVATRITPACVRATDWLNESWIEET
jgi:hypothetical protein